MSTYPISKVYASDARGLARVDALLEGEGIRRDAHLDYTCAMFDDDGRAIATGSCFGNTLRCMAVASDHQGEMLMNEIVTHLVEVEAERGNYRLFLYTKCNSAKFFGNLGFYEVARAEGKAVLMENRRDGFSSYLSVLAKTRVEGARSGAVVMNANPFTTGHLHLVRTAAARVDVLHLFVVSEDASLFPFSVRKRLVIEGTAGIENLIIHDSGPYIISSATFPSYFLGDDESVAAGHAALDAAVFCRIAEALGVTERFCGEERTSRVTAIYNEVMARELPAAGIAFTVIPRVDASGAEVGDGGAGAGAGGDAGASAGAPAGGTAGGTGSGEAAGNPPCCGSAPVSASTVRSLIQAGKLEATRELVPESTYAYLCSPAAEPILARIRAAADVVHH